MRTTFSKIEMLRSEKEYFPSESEGETKFLSDIGVRNGERCEGR
jgi:hypothetical protein